MMTKIGFRREAIRKVIQQQHSKSESKIKTKRNLTENSQPRLKSLPVQIEKLGFQDRFWGEATSSSRRWRSVRWRRWRSPNKTTGCSMSNIFAGGDGELRAEDSSFRKQKWRGQGGGGTTRWTRPREREQQRHSNGNRDFWEKANSNGSEEIKSEGEGGCGGGGVWWRRTATATARVRKRSRVRREKARVPEEKRVRCRVSYRERDRAESS